MHCSCLVVYSICITIPMQNFDKTSSNLYLIIFNKLKTPSCLVIGTASVKPNHNRSLLCHSNSLLDSHCSQATEVCSYCYCWQETLSHFQNHSYDGFIQHQCHFNMYPYQPRLPLYHHQQIYGNYYLSNYQHQLSVYHHQQNHKN